MIEEPNQNTENASELTLDPNQVSELIKDGIDISPDGNHMYILRFGWNNDWNKATDPAPFRIKPHLNEKLRKDAMGMPYVVPPYGEKMHLRKDKDAPEPRTAEEELRQILDVQTKYAIGEIQGSLEYPSGNVWLIIDVWPEFQAGVERGYYPTLVSPTFNFLDAEQTPKGSDVNDAQFINLQTVPNSGYHPKYTQIQPMCKNGIKECMAEMKIHGAAGTIKSSNFSQKSFSSIINEAIGAMSSEEGSAPQLETVAKDVNALKEGFGMLTEKVNMIAEKVGVDSSNNDPAGTPPGGVAGASGTVTKQDYEKLLKEREADKAELKGIKDDFKQYKLDKEIAEKKLREAHVASIIERKARLSKLSDDQKTELKEEYMKKSMDVLETLDNELKAAIPEFGKSDDLEKAGISGAYGLFKPNSTSTTSSEAGASADRPKNSEMFI